MTYDTKKDKYHNMPLQSVKIRLMLEDKMYAVAFKTLDWNGMLNRLGAIVDEDKRPRVETEYQQHIPVD